MNKFVNAIIYGSLTCLVLFQYNGDVKIGAWFVLCGIASLFFSAVIAKRLSYAAAACSLYFIFNALRIFSWVEGDLDKYSVPTLMSLYRHSSYSIIITILLLAMCVSLNRATLHKIVNYFAYLVFFDAILVIIQFAIRRDGYISGGFFYNSSMNACFIASFWPILFSKLRKAPRAVFYGLCLTAVLCSETSMGVGVFAITTLLVFRKYLIAGLVGGGLISGIAYWIQGKELFYSTGRFGIWKEMLTWVWKNENHWTGTGTGTFPVWSVNIQYTGGSFNAESAWLWLHNDWAQLFFEGGFIGLALAAVFFFDTLRKASNELKPSIIAVGLVALGNYPMHDARFTLAISALFAYALKDYLALMQLDRNIRPLANLFGHFKG